MRLVDADHLVFLVNDATILGDGFKQVFTALVNGEPTIEPEHKTGKWIRKTIKDLVGFNTSCYKCSECNAVEAIYSAYCPNCGADMRGEGEQE